jgi:hypothetical protein
LRLAPFEPWRSCFQVLRGASPRCKSLMVTLGKADCR